MAKSNLRGLCIVLFFSFLLVTSGLFAGNSPRSVVLPAGEDAEMSTDFTPALMKSATANLINPIMVGSYADPTVIRVGNEFYLYVTSGRVRGYKSVDMLNWSRINGTYSEVFTTKPDFTGDNINDLGMWAPDINYFDGKYVMYYSMSVWSGGATCGIGVGVSSQPQGPFVPPTGNPNGKLFVSSEIGVHNSIDPCFYEENGKRYLFWGSFYGIYMTELTADGMAVKDITKKTKIAGKSFEATYIHKRGNYYYLFASVGSCCDGMTSTYKVVVGRSQKLEGPYLSKTGVDMKNFDAWNPTNYQPIILKGNSQFGAPGHNSRIITDDNGVDWMFYHSYVSSEINSDNSRQLMLDKVQWSSDGWPTIGNGTPSYSMTAAPSFNHIGTDYTSLIKNNSFELAPDPADCSKSIAVSSTMGESAGWSNNAWRPTGSPCKQFYGWTWDIGFKDNNGNNIMGNSSQGINADPSNKDGNYAAWIAGSYQLPQQVHEFYQVISKNDLPAGTYKVQCLMGVNHSRLTTQRLFANNNVQYYGSKSQYLSNLKAGESYTFANNVSGENNLQEMFVYTTIGENDSLKIGIRTGNMKSDGSIAATANPFWGWFKTDNFRLTKINPIVAADASLASISLSAGGLNFTPQTTSYNVLLPKGTITVNATAVPNVQDVTITGTGDVNVGSGSGVSIILVTALNGTTTKTYTINYTVDNTSGFNDANTMKAACVVTERKLLVTGTDAYTVYNLNGIKVADVKVNESGKAIELTTGIYIVKTQTSEVIKVIVK
jgi:arabinan endo-1,5-alpha-L-arabinosidase